MPIPVILLMRNPVGFRNVINLGNSHRLKRRTLVLLPCDFNDKAIVIKANRTSCYTVVVDIHVRQQSRGLRTLRMRLDNGPRQAIRRGIAQDKCNLKNQKQQHGLDGKAIGKGS